MNEFTVHNETSARVGLHRAVVLGDPILVTDQPVAGLTMACGGRETSAGEIRAVV